MHARRRLPRLIWPLTDLERGMARLEAAGFLEGTDLKESGEALIDPYAPNPFFHRRQDNFAAAIRRFGICTRRIVPTV